MALDDYPYSAHIDDEPGIASFSRRDLLKQGTAAVIGGGATLLGAPALAQAPAQAAAGQAPAIFTQWRPETAGQRFRALVRHRNSLDVQQLTLNPIEPRQVVARVEAAQACYTMVGALNTQTPAMNAAVFGHGAVGTVIEAGPMVKRVQRGDRILVVVTGQCGQCFQCVRGKAANCQAGFNRPPVIVGTMADGTPVNGNLGGFAELIVAWEEMVVPIYSKHDAAELSNLTCVSMCGLGMTMVRAPIESGSTVVVFGAGPIGLSAVQGARIRGASQIIVVEPIRYRRELATKVGATAVLDPSDFADGAALIARLREMTVWVGTNPFGGGRNPAVTGPDYIIEAVGGERFVPKAERYAREPHGLEVLQNVFTLCPPGGFMRTCGVGYPMNSTVTFPAGGWSNGTKNHMGGNLAGVQMMRDLPQWVRMFETGQFDGKSLVGVNVPLERATEAVEASAYRTAVTGIVSFPQT
ncbi:MAG: alcohol dehydrogenase catalytic domain-containing protein [Acidobacteria bacterium]|nr:alcohol dehydrogenase catalytic domain-containing protein [Acidobacteriota bacterium]